MASVLKRLQAFVPTMDDTVGNLGIAPIAEPVVAVVPKAVQSHSLAQSAAVPNQSEPAYDVGSGADPVLADETAPAKAKSKPKPEKRKVYEPLHGIPRTLSGGMDARAMRRTGRTMQISIKLKPELPEAMKVAAYEQGICLGQLMEDMWDAYTAKRRL